ncbi:MAG: hypothetical protein FD178_3671 [Ignavibacteria bacterium]|nr:MAG: hypothetical protein FD178_3671 [Ignavibacteria bacterium]
MKTVIFGVLLLLASSSSFGQEILKSGKVYYVSLFPGTEGYIILHDTKFLFLKSNQNDISSNPLGQFYGIATGSWDVTKGALQLKASKHDIKYTTYLNDTIVYRSFSGKNLDSVYFRFFTRSNTGGDATSIVAYFENSSASAKHFLTNRTGKTQFVLSSKQNIKSLTAARIGFSARNLPFFNSANIHDYEINFFDSNALIQAIDVPLLKATFVRNAGSTAMFTNRVRFTRLTEAETQRFVSEVLTPLLSNRSELKNEWLPGF